MHIDLDPAFFLQNNLFFHQQPVLVIFSHQDVESCPFLFHACVVFHYLDHLFTSRLFIIPSALSHQAIIVLR